MPFWFEVVLAASGASDQGVILMGYSGAQGTLIYEKNLKSNISCQTPFKESPHGSNKPQIRQSSRLSLQFQIGSPAPSNSSECCPPPGSKGETHSLAGEGAGGANSDEREDTLELLV